VSDVNAVLLGMAEALDSAGAATYRPEGGYLADETALVFGPVPTDPDRAVGLTFYGSTDHPSEPEAVYRVQAWCRGVPGDSLDANEVADAVFRALHGRESLSWHGVFVVQVLRISSVPVGADAAGRSQRADNYEVTVQTTTIPGA
jgi:hypothetical protein